MAAVVRVKRRIDEEPLNAFVLNCKRRKVDENASTSLLATKDETATILKFAGTVDNQIENITSQITKLTKDEAKELVTKTRHPDHKSKKREEQKLSSQRNRFKIVNCSRTGENRTIGDKDKPITIVDIEKQTTDAQDVSENVANTSNASAGSQNYVYDLYLPEMGQEPDIDDYFMENLISVQPFDNLVYYDQNAADSDDEFDMNATDDSNDEDNSRNEYPDTENSEDSIDENFMRRRVEKFNIDDSDLSSDDESLRDDYVHSIDTDDLGFENDLDRSVVNRYGVAYAKYKKRILKEQKDEWDDYYHSTDDEELPKS